jgi:hypothetical protein
VLNILIGLVLGVVSSLAAWIVVTQLLKPNVAIGKFIERWDRPDGSRYYRFAVGNARRWRFADDVTVTARFNVLKRRPSGRVVTNWFNVPVDDAWIPSLLPRRRRKAKRFSHYPVLLFRNAPPAMLEGMPAHLRAQGDAMLLEDVLAWSGGGVRLIVFATDRFSATRKMFIGSLDVDNIAHMETEGARHEGPREAD